MGEAPEESRPGGGSGGRAGAEVRAEGLGLTGARGEVFGDICFSAPPGSLVALEGPSGSGRTCLLLALTGRMRTTSGHAVVGGHRLPGELGAVRRISALGAVPGVTDLEPGLSVAEQLREQVLLRRRFDGSLRALLTPPARRAAASRARLDASLSAAGLDLDSLPKGPRTLVRDLERLESLRLSVAIALLGEPRLLAVDDVGLKLTDDEAGQAWSLLRSVAEAGTTVLAACSQAPGDALTVCTGRENRGPSRNEGAGDEGAGNEEGPAREQATITEGDAAHALAEACRA
ncbi:ABC-type multidrug transport system, ATPase component [Streptomyces sp. WMMB 714]|uniref:ATP-binding cassette domain-containing protein n=1 Tax=Streptomyces sp. WMMB 714 TaxID=1286822 RepID=UPI0005F7B765|nr:ATP-binding cassette domain-containing protein [Streptomyces sp. WMMB 714]SCK28107.1 ABC-type multidrug transport system, ATPase component [Streptomyces sp. WMMB 714]